MILIDTSVWIEVLRDKKGDIVKSFRDRIQDDIWLLSRFTRSKMGQKWGQVYGWVKNGVKSTVDPCSKLIRVKSRLDPFGFWRR